MQATIAGIHADENNEEDHDRKMRAGIFWDNGHSKTLDLDGHCHPLEVAPDDEIIKELPTSFEPGLRNEKKSTPNLMVILYWNRGS